MLSMQLKPAQYTIVKQALPCLLVVLCLLGIGSGRVKSQSLVLENLMIADTLVLDQMTEVSFTVRNASNTGLTGNLQFWFENHSNDSVAMPLGAFINTLQFFAPGQVRQFVLPVEVTPDFFIEGGNTVVIWPSMVGEPRPEDLSTEEVYVLDPNGITRFSLPEEEQIWLINPAEGYLRMIHPPSVPTELVLMDFAGRVHANGAFDASGRYKLEGIKPGLYFVLLRNLRNGESMRQRILIR